MKKVLHVPELKKNLFSLCKISQLSFNINLSMNNLSAMGDRVKMNATLIRLGIYKMNVQTVRPKIAHMLEWTTWKSETSG